MRATFFVARLAKGTTIRGASLRESHPATPCRSRAGINQWLLTLWRRIFVWLHLPALLWAALVEFANLSCPLTPLEKWLLEREGRKAYAGGFLENHLLSLLYPGQLTRENQIALGLLLLAANALVYALVLKKGMTAE